MLLRLIFPAVRQCVRLSVSPLRFGVIKSRREADMTALDAGHGLLGSAYEV